MTKNIFSTPKNQYSEKIFWDFRNINLEISQNQDCEKYFFGILIFCIEKYFSSKNIFSLFFHKICSILTKYEGITPKTPKVRLIFRFFLRVAFFFQPLQRYRRGGQLSKNIFQNLRFSIEKIFFSSNFLFWSKTHTICFIHANYDCLTPKTLEVRRI